MIITILNLFIFVQLKKNCMKLIFFKFCKYFVLSYKTYYKDELYILKNDLYSFKLKFLYVNCLKIGTKKMIKTKELPSCIYF